MKVTARGLLRSTGIAAIVAGLLFVIIQPLHPADTLASVTTTTWATIHYLTLVMGILFVIGMTGLYVRQIDETGWLALIGFLAASLGLLIQAPIAFIEGFVDPLLVKSSPDFVDGLLKMVEGNPSNVDLGAIPMLHSISGAMFLGGCILFGIVTFRARVLPRWGAALFAGGVVVTAPIALALDLPRLTAVPIGLGLAWMGYGLWSDQRATA